MRVVYRRIQERAVLPGNQDLETGDCVEAKSEDGEPIAQAKIRDLAESKQLMNAGSAGGQRWVVAEIVRNEKQR